MTDAKTRSLELMMLRVKKELGLHGGATFRQLMEALQETKRLARIGRRVEREGKDGT